MSPYMPSPAEFELLKWSIGQGALAVVLLVVFWKYRSDMKALIDQRGQELIVLTTLVSDSKTAQNDGAVAARALREEVQELGQEIRRLAEVIEQLRMTRTRG